VAEGETFYLRVRDILAAIQDAEAEVSQAGRRPRGRLRINCVTGFAYHELPNALPAFASRYPEIKHRTGGDGSSRRLAGGNADIGIRSRVITDPSLVTRKIAEFDRALYAAPRYLERRGVPRSRRTYYSTTAWSMRASRLIGGPSA
jgi:DNA-binding transcriptional LysR family regulator